MIIDEVEVYLTPDGLGRAAIVRRSDGFFSIYVHWILAPEYRNGVFAVDAPTSWNDKSISVADLYEGAVPASGILGTLGDARREVYSFRGFANAQLTSSS